MRNSAKTEDKKPKSAPESSEKTQLLSSLSENGLGGVKIHDDVIISLAKNAALSVEGVARLAGNALVSSLADLVGSTRINSRAISVTQEEGKRISLSLKVILLAGCRIPDVAEKIQKAVISAVGEATGMEVTSVQILVQDVEAPRPASQGKASDAKN